MVTSIEFSASGSITSSSSSEDDTTDYEDFLDILANALDDEFDLNLDLLCLDPEFEWSHPTV